MRRRSDKKKSKRRRDPDWFNPDVEKPDLPVISKVIIRKVREPNFRPQIEECDPREELADLELKINRIRYTMFIARWKISKKHSTKEYCV